MCTPCQRRVSYARQLHAGSQHGSEELLNSDCSAMPRARTHTHIHTHASMHARARPDTRTHARGERCKTQTLRGTWCAVGVPTARRAYGADTAFGVHADARRAGVQAMRFGHTKLTLQPDGMQRRAPSACWASFARRVPACAPGAVSASCAQRAVGAPGPAAHRVSGVCVLHFSLWVRVCVRVLASGITTLLEPVSHTGSRTRSYFPFAALVVTAPRPGARLGACVCAFV